MVFTFQLAMRSARNFFFLVFLPGAGIMNPLVERNYLSEASRSWRGSTLLAGGVQLPAGGNHPMRFEILSHRRNQTLEPWSALYIGKRD